jgi:hypothetical protein
MKMNDYCELCIKENVLKEWRDKRRHRISQFDMKLFEDESIYKSKQCEHSFHKCCARMWYKKQKECPICNVELKPHFEEITPCHFLEVNRCTGKPSYYYIERYVSTDQARKTSKEFYYLDEKYIDVMEKIRQDCIE